MVLIELRGIAWRAGGISNGQMDGRLRRARMSVGVIYSNGISHKLVLIQLMHLSTSSSGYDTTSRNATELKKPSARVSSKPTSRHDAWVRRNPYDFTGCLAHAELTERASDGAVSTVVGYFIHNESCQQSVMKRLPPVPLHPHVYEIALAQLEGGAKLVPPVLSAVARLMPLQPSVHTIEESPHD
jgi:hypothetical protein